MYEYKARMIKVVDGDTMDFEIDLGFKIKHEIRIRLKDIDTPELYKPRNAAEKKHAQEAGAFVTKKFLGKTGILMTHKDKKGKYGRYLAEFKIRQSTPDVNAVQYLLLSEALHANGFAKQELYDGMAK